MEEWTLEQWHEQMTKEKAVLYLYTPMCGTCAVASKMMEVVEQVSPALALGKMNLNFAEQLAYEYEIESVPCLLITKNGKVQEKVYAFESVVNLYELLKSN